MQNVCFNGNMDNFKLFNFPSGGHIESLSLDKFLTVLKILPCHEMVLVT